MQQHAVADLDARHQAADALGEAWEAMQDAYRNAMRLLRSDPAYDRLDGYLGRVFSPSDRMLGMQSIDDWMTEATDALLGIAPDVGDDEDGDDETTCGDCGAGYGQCHHESRATR